MNLAELKEAVGLRPLGQDGEVVIPGLAYDSRRVEPGQAFFALPGAKADGSRFIGQALAKGAGVIVGQAEPPADLGPAVYLRVPEARAALALAAQAFYGHPTRNLRLFGVTGTSGKTTTAYALEAVLSAAHLEVGVLGTNNYRFAGRAYPAPVTTPESLDLAGYLAEMVEASVEAAVMEVSSHALAQHRAWGCRFEAAAFTNLSRDHLDYHLDFETYFQAKRRLFTELAPAKGAAVNLDDPYGRRLLEELGGAAVSYGLAEGAQVTAREVHLNGCGLRAEVTTPTGGFLLASPLVGQFNLQNLLAAAALAWLAGVDHAAMAQGLNGLTGVPGRMEDVGRPFGRRVIVDYSHKVEALARALAVVREITPGRVTAVFGCGGDRDQGKRPLMGRAAAEGSDLIILTSDNPRSEDPRSIIAMIAAGVEAAGWRRIEPEPELLATARRAYAVVEDRRRAIALAVAALGPEDALLVAGKGHEDYQIVGERKLHLDDREEAVAALRTLDSGGARCA